MESQTRKEIGRERRGRDGTEMGIYKIEFENFGRCI